MSFLDDHEILGYIGKTISDIELNEEEVTFKFTDGTKLRAIALSPDIVSLVFES